MITALLNALFEFGEGYLGKVRGFFGSVFGSGKSSEQTATNQEPVARSGRHLQAQDGAASTVNKAFKSISEVLDEIARKTFPKIFFDVVEFKEALFLASESRTTSAYGEFLNLIIPLVSSCSQAMKPNEDMGMLYNAAHDCLVNIRANMLI